jgi:carboxyl-terminal processing protease
MARLLAGGESLMAAALARHAAARAPVPPAEVAALRTACPPAEGREADLSVARMLLNDSAAWHAAANSAAAAARSGGR